MEILRNCKNTHLRKSLSPIDVLNLVSRLKSKRYAQIEVIQATTPKKINTKPGKTNSNKSRMSPIINQITSF